MADDRPVDAEVDNEVIELFAEDNPVDVEVDNEVIELFADDKPVEVEVDNDVTELFVELSPVDNEPIELLAEDNPVDADVDRLASWLPFTASVLAADTVPGARLVIFWLLRLAPPFNDARPDTWTAPTMLVPFVPPLMYAPFDST
ncbi:ATPase [Burkholderia lata]|uniref:ATPase n=1 Tax=Burkholderia lata (strain ATCC 17760 / DSM 23089 / LMG 22485 / NCIMB 9086 / R18194 / 383) TaxID=482957 RepID=A0A6P2WRB6_BURL3|nr:ATPase [Burkholderia lata]